MGQESPVKRKQPEITPDADGAVARHKTAIARYEPSRPVRRALADGLITPTSSVLDYGCGRGDDVRLLEAAGVASRGWDPVHAPDAPLAPADVVNIGYVVNVIEDPSERAEAVRQAWSLSLKLLVVSARLVNEARNTRQSQFGDGYLTRLNTFQKYFEHSELRAWVDETLGVRSVPAAPGVLYVFRDETLEQQFISSRYTRAPRAPRPRKSDVLFEQYRHLFEPFLDFVERHGRIPEFDELLTASDLASTVGSLRRAFDIVRRATGADQWEDVRNERSQDLLVYISLGKFRGRPRFTALPLSLQRDIKAFFSSYSKACDAADRLLFSLGSTDIRDAACRRSSVGKLTPTALYVHESALPMLPPELRVYEGCAHALIGTVEGANVVKLYRDEPQVSYLSYPSFERAAHPELVTAVTVNLRTFREKHRTYEANPPILHRKELFVGSDHPDRDKFARLTAQEEKAGLLENSEHIGTRDTWQAVLEDRGYRLSGHRLVRAKHDSSREDNSA